MFLCSILAFLLSEIVAIQHIEMDDPFTVGMTSFLVFRNESIHLAMSANVSVCDSNDS